MIRLDKFIAQAATITRSQAKKLISQQVIKVSGITVTDAKYKVALDANIELNNQLIKLVDSRYIILNKPPGYICSTQDEAYPTALNLIKLSSANQLHFAGRLDVDTTGLVLISDDGHWTHRITSPRKKYNKTYCVTIARELTAMQIYQLECGVELTGDDKKTLPAQVKKLSNNQLLLTINEGRYHQVKRMLAAVGNHVESLHREKIGALNLDGLNVGEWRELSDDEVKLF